MSPSVSRLRMFAGPNGSGKTTIKNGLQKSASWFGIYINPDELEKSIRETGRFSLEPFGLTTTTEEIQSYFANSSFLQQQHLHTASSLIECTGGELNFSQLSMNSYYASVLSDFLRRKALEISKSFSFETVMSSPDKIELLEEAQGRGYRTYLYFIATEDPFINLGRVRNRVAEGGHDVPEEKVVARYRRTLDLLPRAIRASNRAYFFDTTTEESWHFAEITEGKSVELKSNEIPEWFKPIWEQF